MDNESTHDTFYAKRFLTNIRPADEPIDVNTNGGLHTCNMIGDLAGYGWVYYNPHGIANILSMANVESSGCRITYDTYKGGDFKVHSNQKVLSFRRLTCGLYALDARKKTSFSLINTVDENKQMFTPRQIQQAQDARDLYEMIGFPSLKDYKMAMQTGLIKNSKVDSSDNKNMTTIFGKNLGAIQGKTTRGKSSSVRFDYIALPKELLDAQQHIVLTTNVMSMASHL